MKVITSVKDLIATRIEIQNQDKIIGFVPTMGALHQGHISLVNISVENNDLTIASVFVNPKQFNDKNDFENYPINHDADIKLLEAIGCDFVFIPQGDDVYNNYSGIKMDFEGLDEIFEGEFRPGHFQGVVDVVYRLFDLVKPHRAYFGQKDFQQLAVIKKMVKCKELNIEIISCPIVREENGLAMSSRNERLTTKQRSDAAVIYSTMSRIGNGMKVGDLTPGHVDIFIEELKKVADMSPEYCVFCHPDTLQEIKKVEKDAVIVMCVAVWCAKVRLIDNIILEF